MIILKKKEINEYHENKNCFLNLFFIHYIFQKYIILIFVWLKLYIESYYFCFENLIFKFFIYNSKLLYILYTIVYKYNNIDMIFLNI